jgi:hypothetical protein
MLAKKVILLDSCYGSVAVSGALLAKFEGAHPEFLFQLEATIHVLAGIFRSQHILGFDLG